MNPKKQNKKVVSSNTNAPTKNIITHIYLNDKYLNSIPKIPNLFDVFVLYLYNNEISEIKNLETATNLSSLYLQKNRILKIENLNSLKKLKKLYLGHNTISVLEGLDSLENLEELHIEKQFLSGGNALCFDPRSIFQISATLQILNIANNRIESIACLKPLKHLRILNAAYNNLENIEQVCELLKEWFYLKEVNFFNNPMTKKRLYKEEIISSIYCIEVLDEKEVSATTRDFLKRLHYNRTTNNLKKITNLAERFPDDLSKNLPVSVQKAVTMKILKQQELCNCEIFDEKNAVYIPWKILPKPPTTVNVKKNFKKPMKPQISTTILQFQI